MWTFRRNAAGEIEAHDGERIRALIVKRPKSTQPWQVIRVNHHGVPGGNDCFRTLTTAKAFCADNPAVWGVQ